MKSIVRASAPGKIILSGEHFVVHGSTAIAASITKRVSVSVSTSDEQSRIVSGQIKSLLQTDDGLFLAAKSVANDIWQEYGKSGKNVEISISSQIPEGSGLGSSAAVSVATAASLLKYCDQKFDLDTVCRHALAGERRVHGNPSGIDIQASAKGGVIKFNKNSGASPIRIENKFDLLVVYSGFKRKTETLISKVAERKNHFPNYFERLTEAATLISNETITALEQDNLVRVGELMSIAQALLSWIGVSTNELDSLIETLSQGDSLGAKITGAGGGGSVIAIPRSGASRKLLGSISSSFSDSFITSVPQEGLRWEGE